MLAFQKYLTYAEYLLKLTAPALEQKILLNIQLDVIYGQG